MIQINILAHNSDRIIYTLKSIDFLKLINNKDKIKVVICYGENSDLWINKVNELNMIGISSEARFIPNGGNNYMDKIESLVESDCEYSCSMDDDILISNYLWDYMIENINILDDESNLFLAPLISNGIPSVEIFIEDFCNDSDKKIMYDIFKNTKIDNYWGVDYSSLNYPKLEWNGPVFYNKVSELNHYYKGIHPVRISLEAHSTISNIICNNKEKIVESNNFFLQKYRLPYFCNSFYFIKTSTWKKIINDKSLFRDIYDEVPLNIYRESNDLNMVFVRNGFCLHMAYNTINTNNQKNIEKYYIENFIKKI